MSDQFDITLHFKSRPVLDKGFVELVDGMVNHPLLKVVNAARVSFNRRSESLTEADQKLIRYLRAHKHFSTFRHSYYTFRIKAPLFVFRQWWKHQIGCEWIETEYTGSIELPSTSWNEVSGRYTAFRPDFYIPSKFKLQSESNRQASGETHPESIEWVEKFAQEMESSYQFYESMLAAGISREQARMVLPQNIYSECVLTLSLQALIYFFEMRLTTEAQAEIKEYAQVMFDLVFPFVGDVVKP